MQETKEIQKETILIDVEKILSMIPHRYPLLLVDRIVEMERGESMVGVKNVTVNEPHFLGHFPSKPIMPGVLIIEALAQTSAIMVVDTLGDSVAGKLVYFMSIDECRFRKPVVPGDRLMLHVKKIQSRGMVWKLACEARVDGQKVAEAIISAMIHDKA